MGDLMQQLEAQSTYLARGSACFIQRIRLEEGDQRAREVWDLVQADGYPTSIKRRVLGQNGYQASDQSIRRHAAGGCQGCTAWL